MGAVIGDILFLGFGIFIGPLPTIVVILLLSGQHGRVKGLAYLVGWIIGLTLLVIGVGLLTSSFDFRRERTPSPLLAWASLVGGVTLLILAYVTWRRRPPPDATPTLPGWLKTIDQTTPLMALGVGFFFGLVSLKNFVFTTAAAAAVGKAQLDIVQTLIAVLLFIAIATAGIATPVYVAFAKEERAQVILAGWIDWLSANNTLIVCLLGLLFGIRLVGDGLGDLM